ncbi:hypothetical protein [Actinoplanes aureus]|uniref:Uncharacterized protein n=1 Tax=Actinoplanes aureus TaxID=2792083 RepID=A0A931CQB3_9ACTN|nr:hypothetical protein [Actinoplanes aureus]MBG0569155.1 hypothetical protein [Actinoplanes aureus]
MATEVGTQFRRALAKAALMPGVGWAVVVVALLGAATRGASPPLLNLAIFVIPGFAFVPATIFVIHLHRAADQATFDRAMRRVLVSAGIGLALLIGAGYALSGLSD